jgi:hypothetical protein
MNMFNKVSIASLTGSSVTSGASGKSVVSKYLIFDTISIALDWIGKTYSVSEAIYVGPAISMNTTIVCSISLSKNTPNQEQFF